MLRLSIAFVVWLALVSPACALVAEDPVSPRFLETDSYLLSVSTNAAQNGVAFHVTITAKKFDIEANSWARLEIITNKLVTMIHSKPAIPFTLEKAERVWKADFIIPREALNNPDLYFVFGVPYDPLNGKQIPLPDAYIYQIRLQDSAKP
jgi:hypothetical protein